MGVGRGTNVQVTATGPSASIPLVGPEELLRRARGGDGEAFCRLAGEEEGRLLRRAWVLCGDPGLAEDLVAETMVAAWQGLSRFDGRCRFSTWLHAILLRRHWKQTRAARSRPVSATRLAREERERGEDRLRGQADPEADALAGVVEDEVLWRVRDALAGLREEHRAVLTLRFFEEATLEEIAAALELPVGTVKSRLHHGLEKLRRSAGMVVLREERRTT